MASTLDCHEYCTGGFDPEDIVISGIAGRFPECDNVGELKESLYNKKDLVVFRDDRFEKGAINVPYSSCGLIKNLDKVDAKIFRLTPYIANVTDPAARIHMEVTCEAIADAGYDPFDMKGEKIGIFNATTCDDTYRSDTNNVNNVPTPFTFRTMNPNRTSYTLDFTGPSFTVDSACSSSGTALWCAVNSIKSGAIDAAVVSGCQLNLLPDAHAGFIKLGISTPTGNSRPFDAKSDGMVRTEAITAVFLQKAKVARRAYATVSAVRFYASGFNPEGISVTSETTMKRIMQDTLEEANIDQNEIEYVETHGTGTEIGDRNEVKTLCEIFCSNRKEPLLIGTIKSNLGHTEASSGLCGIIKTLITFENDCIPPNIKYEKPRCPALLDGKVKVVTEPTPFNGKYIPISCVGFAGTFVQILLKKNPMRKENKSKSSKLPRLVLYPATTEEAIATMFDYIQNNPNLPDEFFALLNKLSFTDPFLKPFRGYALHQEGKAPISLIKTVPSAKRPVWFIMTGIGCQWPGMGIELMKINAFAESMQKSAEIMNTLGVDLFEILNEDGKNSAGVRNITSTIIGICSIQMALIDVLKHLGITPDGIIGHSTGEIACAYADGCLTAEEVLKSGFYRGKAIDDANLPEGGMIAVGISWSEAQRICPEGCYPACDNADDSVTISGLKEPLEKFTEKLKEDNVFFRWVNSHGYTFHCEHVRPSAGPLKSSLSKNVSSSNQRSKRWISSSYPPSEWDTPGCKTINDDYFVHNLVSSVQFNSASKMIPSDAIIIEIGPHFLLRSILKRTVGSKASFFGLMKKNEENSLQFFMDSLGQLYNEGVDPKIDRLYPPVQFPVPRGTPTISDLIRWDHSQSYNVIKYTAKGNEFFKEFKFDKEDAYILDHQIDGKSLFPATGYICLAWEALASKLQKNVQEMSVVIENFKIHRATIITPTNPTKFFVSVLESSGRFEITEGKFLVASGNISEGKNLTLDNKSLEYVCNGVSLAGSDIYDELKRSGYEYGPFFQNLVETNADGTAGEVLWRDQWIPFLDSLLLFFGLVTSNGGLYLPTGALSFKIDPKVLKNTVDLKTSNTNKQDKNAKSIPVMYDKDTRTCHSPGVEISNLNMDLVSHKGKSDKATLEEYRFVSYVSEYIPTDDSSLRVKQYFHACNEVISTIGAALRKDVKKFQLPNYNNFKFSLEEYMNEKEGSQQLLRDLRSLITNSHIQKEKIKECFDSYSLFAGKDVLNNALVNEDSLRIMVEIIYENTFKKLNVVEINRNFPVVSNHMADILKKFFHLSFKKSVLIASKTTNLNQELLEEHNIQVQTEEKLKDIIKEKVQDIAISSFSCGSISDLKNLLQTLTSVVKPSGFILLFYKERANPAEMFLSSVTGEDLQVLSETVLEEVLQDKNLIVLSKISDPFGGSLYLLRSPSLTRPQSIVHITEDGYDWVEKIKKELFERKFGPVWLVSQESHASGIIGMMNCLKQEPGGERIRCVFTPSMKRQNGIPFFDVQHPFFKDLIKKDLIMNVWKDGCWGSFRHILIKETKIPRPVDHSFVNCRKYGDLSSFEWAESNVKYVEPKNRKLLHIYYSALNFKDVMLATGKLSVNTVKDLGQGSSVLGLEFSGREEGTGKRICGFAESRSMATSILAEPAFCFDIPDHWTLEDAATVPVVYATCYYALIMRAKLQKGESILIHSGTGGIGIAAIRIALSLNCEIFTTVGTNEKKEYLRKTFPQIKEENIGCSRNTSFETMVKKRTKGKGVNVVLNSLADDKFLASIRCVANSGRFVEIGKYDLALDREIGLKIFLNNISFHGVFLDQLFDLREEVTETVEELSYLIQNGIKTGVVQPLDRKVFDRHSIEQAFRYMSKGVHIGKIVLKIRDEEIKNCAIPKCLRLPAITETQFYYNKVYIIIGGLGGFGMEVTKWMIRKGAKTLILTSRYGARTPYHHFCLKKWQKQGINVQVSTLNVAIKSEAEKLLNEASRIGAIGGIFNSALILRDAFMDCQTAEAYEEVCAPKAAATLHLDELSRKLCPSLDYFVCFSSISCGRGNAGQTNYGYANSVMERICEERKSAGYPGLAIQWGIIGEVGLAHRQMGDDAMIAGITSQSVKSCLESLDVFCQQDCAVVTSYVAAQQVQKAVQGNVMDQILKILGIEESSQIDLGRNLGQMGMDSFVGVEIAQLLQSHANVNVTMQEIQELTFGEIKNLLESNSEQTIPKAPSLLSTTKIKLPPILSHKAPLNTFNKEVPGEPIFIVNIGDTDVSNFQILSKMLNRPIYALVWTKDIPSTNTESLSSYYLKLIQDSVKCPFHIVGHSIGGNVAFEMALQSTQKHIPLKSISLLNGSEELMNALSEDNSKNRDLEVEALCRFVDQFVCEDAFKAKLQYDLSEVTNQEQKIHTVLNCLTNSSSETINRNEVSEALFNCLIKHKICNSYVPKKKLSMDINIIENSTKLLANDVSLVKETFEKVCTGKISVHRVLYDIQSSNEEDFQQLTKILLTIV